MTHRYLGVVMGLLMLVWFASGVVMLFARWPELTPERQVDGLAPIEWTGCCDFGALVGPQVIGRAVIENLNGHPVLRLEDEVVDLTTGKALAPLSEMDAWRVAETFAARTGLKARPQGVTHIHDRDQWTVSGQYNPQRPLWRVRLADDARTDIYVSARTGEVVLTTNGPERLLAWLGPIPHWLYPRILRQDAKLWNAVVVWTSLAGTFLTVTGLYLGAIQWRPWRDRRVTPYRGVMAWHHLVGLAAGVFTLAWVVSGLVSMNPWGFLEGRPDNSSSRITGEVIFDEVRPALLAARGAPARRVEMANLGGRVFLMADGKRLDAQGGPLPLTQDILVRAGQAIGPVAHQEMIAAEDAYYHSGHEGPVPLPAWRVVLKDGVRFYLDPVSGQPRARFDRDAQSYRWMFEGLHRLDVIRGFDRGPGWMAVMLTLLLVAGGGVATGVWLGWRRIGMDFARFRARLGPPPQA